MKNLGECSICKKTGANEYFNPEMKFLGVGHKKCFNKWRNEMDKKIKLEQEKVWREEEIANEEEYSRSLK